MTPIILFADAKLSWGRPARMELRRRGARVQTARSVDEALRLARAAAPDLLILDDDLEGHEGRDLAELFRTELPAADIILLESGAMPRGVGLGLLYSGPRDLAYRQLVGLAEGALGSRLGKAEEERRPKRVLCVDDEEACLKSLARTLTRRGYSVSAFNAAERALQAVPWTRPDVVLVDIMMPGMGGLDLARRIMESSAVPVVFVTGLDTDEVRYQAHQNGARFLVSKAEAPERLMDVVDRVTGELDEPERELLERSG